MRVPESVIITLDHEVNFLEEMIMYTVFANRSARLRRRFTVVLEILIVLSIAPALAFGVWSIDSLPVA